MAKKIAKIVVVILSIALTNFWTKSYVKQKSIDKFSNVLNTCILKTDLEKIISIDIKKVKSGSEIIVSNNSKCIVVENIEISFSYFTNEISDSIALNISESIKPNIEATISLNKIVADSIYDLRFDIKKISPKFVEI